MIESVGSSIVNDNEPWKRGDRVRPRHDAEFSHLADFNPTAMYVVAYITHFRGEALLGVQLFDPKHPWPKEDAEERTIGILARFLDKA